MSALFETQCRTESWQLRDKVVFAIVKTVHENSYLDIDEATILGSIRALHEKLESEDLLSD